MNVFVCSATYNTSCQTVINKHVIQHNYIVKYRINAINQTSSGRQYKAYKSNSMQLKPDKPAKIRQNITYQ